MCLSRMSTDFTFEQSQYSITKKVSRTWLDGFEDRQTQLEDKIIEFRSNERRLELQLHIEQEKRYQSMVLILYIV